MPTSNAPLLTRPSAVFLLATFCCLLWGSAYPSIKQGYALFDIARHDVASQMLFAGVRFVAAGLLLLMVGAVMGWGLRIKREFWPGLVGLGLTQTALQYVFFYIGLAHATGTKGSILNSSSTFFSVLLAHFIYHNDRLSHRRLLGCLVGFIGVAAVNYGPALLQPDFTWAGEGAIVLAAFVLSAATIYGKRLSQHLNPAVMTGWQMLIGGAVLLTGGWLAGGQMSAFTPTSTALMVYMAVLSALAFSIWSALLKHNPVGRVTIFNFLMPVFGVALSAVFLGENVFEWKYGVALVLVCAGIWLVTAEKRQLHATAPVRQPVRA